MRRGGWRVGLVALVGFASEHAFAADESPFSVAVDGGAALVRYTETGQREFEGLETEWEEIAFRFGTEARYRAPFGIVPLLRFAFLTSAEDTETNNVGAATTELRIEYFFTVQPGLAYDWQPHPQFRISPEFSWDFDWYRQVRDTGEGDVQEDVDWSGPSPGVTFRYDPWEDWGVELTYHHSFLIDVNSSNSFSESLGFGEFSTEGDRDLLSLHVLRKFGERWFAGLGYRFESSRVDASETASRFSVGLGGVESIQVQFPENEHTIHVFEGRFGLRF